MTVPGREILWSWSVSIQAMTGPSWRRWPTQNRESIVPREVAIIWKAAAASFEQVRALATTTVHQLKDVGRPDEIDPESAIRLTVTRGGAGAHDRRRPYPGPASLEAARIGAY
jgi:hypothetical protein